MTTTVLAAIDDSAAADPVLRVARALATTLGAGARAVHAREGEQRTAEEVAAVAGVPLDVVEGDEADVIATAAHEPGVEALVIGARAHPAGGRPGGHVALGVLGRVHVPVVVVPPDLQRTADGLRRVLLPLEGTRQSTDAVAEAVRRLVGCGAEVVGMHVFRPGTTPRFWDQAHHAGPSFAGEFLERWCTSPEVELHLRTGDVATAILEAASEHEVDLIALGWSQRFDEDRARVVREVLGRAVVPVLLLPVR